MARLTLIGMYDFDDTIFDNLTVPEAIDKPTLIDNILLRSGDFEVLYPDTEFLKFSIGAWSRKWQPTLNRWASALSLEYNPLENYDRQEDWTDTNTGTQTNTNTGTQTLTNTGTQTTTNTGTETTTNTGTETTTNTGTETTTNTGTQTSVGSGGESTVKSGSEKEQADGGSTTENKTSAFDTTAGTWTDKDKTIFDTDQSNERTYNDVTDTHTLNDLTTERTDDLTAERTDDLTQERTDDLTQERTDDLTQERTDDLTQERTDDLTQERTDDLEAHHEGRVHGNIGVTTSQQMLKSELDLGYWNIYEKITDLFLTEFIIPVY